ncbi:MAG: signal peptidase I [Bdellovibrionales bacterium]
MAEEKKNLKASFSESTISFVGAILAVLAVRWLLFEPYVIPSGSMIPTLLIHDHILVNKLAYGVRWPFTKSWMIKFGEPKRGDIVVFRSVEEDGKFMIKRVVGVAGDTVEFTDAGQLLVNNEPVPHEPMGDSEAAAVAEPFYPVSAEDVGFELSNLEFYKDKIGEKTFRSLLIKEAFRWRLPPVKVGEGKLFMMGDNRDNSKDSRSWGELPAENVLGRALFVWLSCEQTTPVLTFLCNPLTVRWKRFFHSVE